MKNLITIVFALMSINLMAIDVLFDINPPYFNAVPATNRTVVLQALSPFPGNLMSYTTDSNGQFTAAGLFTGVYGGTIKAKGDTSSIDFMITLNNAATNETVRAESVTSVGSVQTYPAAGRSAYSVQASDLRYFRNNGTNALATVQNMTNTAQYYSILNTNFTLLIGLYGTNNAIAYSNALAGYVAAEAGVSSNYSRTLNSNKVDKFNGVATNLTIHAYPDNEDAVIFKHDNDLAFKMYLPAGGGEVDFIGAALYSFDTLVQSSSVIAYSNITAGAIDGHFIGKGLGLTDVPWLALTGVPIFQSGNLTLSNNLACGIVTNGQLAAAIAPLVGANYVLGIAANNTNFTLLSVGALGTNSTNFTLSLIGNLGTNSTNFSLALALNGSNNVSSNIARLLLATNGTAQEQFTVNGRFAIRQTNGYGDFGWEFVNTNGVLQLIDPTGAGALNVQPDNSWIFTLPLFVDSGAYESNLLAKMFFVNTAANNGSNFTLAATGSLGTNATNFTLLSVGALGTNSTNYSLALAANGSNNVFAVSTNLTNYANQMAIQNITLYLYNSQSNFGASNFYIMQPTPSAAILTTNTYSGANVNLNTYPISYALTNISLQSINIGVYEAHVQAYYSGTGGPGISLQAELYVRRTNNVLEEIGVGPSIPLTTSYNLTTWPITVTNLTTLNSGPAGTDYPVLRLKITSVSGTVTLRIVADGNSGAHFSLSVPSEFYQQASTNLTALANGNGNSLTNINSTNIIINPINLVYSGLTNVIMDCNSGQIFTLLLTNNAFIIPTNCSGKFTCYTLNTLQDATGNRTVTWQTNRSFNSARFSGGIPYSSTTNAASQDVWTMVTSFYLTNLNVVLTPNMQ